MKNLKRKLMTLSASLILGVGLLYLPALNATNTASAQGPEPDTTWNEAYQDCVPPAIECLPNVDICVDRETGEKVPCEN